MKYMRICNIILFVAMVVVNVLANTVPLGGQNTGEVSANYPTMFTPAPYTFSIWGLIYLFMGIFVVMQFLSDSPDYVELVDTIGIWFSISCILNVLWIFCWQYGKIELSLIPMILLLLSLIIINMSIYSVRPNSLFGKMAMYGFNIYLGWITAATIANVSVVLTKIGWSGWGISDLIWTIIILAVGTVIGVAFSVVGGRFMATLAVVWAYVGILVKNMSVVNGISNKMAVNWTAIIVTVVCICVMLVASVGFRNIIEC